MGQMFLTLFMILHLITWFILRELRIAAEYFEGDNNVIPTFTDNTKYWLGYFYAFKMVVSIAFLCENAVERFQKSIFDWKIQKD